MRTVIVIELPMMLSNADCGGLFGSSQLMLFSGAEVSLSSRQQRVSTTQVHTFQEKLQAAAARLRETDAEEKQLLLTPECKSHLFGLLCFINMHLQ